MGNLVRFSQFLGLEVQGEFGGEVKVVIASHFDERRGDCWDAMFGGNHNWLRISRVLQCLGLCGMYKEQKAFMECLREVQSRGNQGKPLNVGSSGKYWEQRAKTRPNYPGAP